MAINYRGTNVARNLGMVAPVRTYGSVTAGNAAVFADATGRRIKDGGTPVRQQDFAAVADLPEDPTLDEVVLALRSTLAVLKGAAKIALVMLALGAGAQSARLGSLRASDTVVTNEQDALAYPVATNALALAEGALQAEADTLATVTARGGTTTSAVTIGSRGEGVVGVSSFAHGEDVVASGAYGHAEGVYTTASGENSHAEGVYTTASGENSHAEGFGTIASGDYSHAEGAYTTASGEYSHAEGLGTTASGHSSHAEGLGTTAIGEASHAEGLSTTASGGYSHAEGDSTTASGEYSHAEGTSTTASGGYSHASGFNSVASSITAFAWQGSSGYLDEPEYGSHGNGTFNLNPVGGLAGLWIGETNMATTLSAYATTGAVAAVQAEVGAGTNWLTRTGLSGTVAFANDGGRPQAWSGTGALTVSGFTGLTPPSQVYWTMSGFDSVTLPAGVYVVGGGSWQPNMVNHFTLWQTGTNVLMSFITATEAD